MKARKYFITLNNYSTGELDLLNDICKGGEYGITCEEVGSEKGTPHIHGYVRYTNPRSWDKIKKLLPRANIQKAKGCDHDQVYLKKDGKFTEHGVPSETSQGKRTDLDTVKNQIIEEGRRVDDIALNDPMLFHQYGRTLERIELISLRKKWRKHMTEGIWYVGPSGSGKSHRAFLGFCPETHYVKNINEEWWDGYVGQPIVVINEFRGQISFSELLDLVDKWPKMVKWRGRESVPFLAETVIVTSIKTPQACYHNLTDDEPWEQFNRRFEVVHMADGQPEEALDADIG